jgi:protein-S-isoprenylcysteine O-methyltransferase Ste14
MVFWLLIHPFIHFWRRQIPAVTYGFVCLLISGIMALLFRMRSYLMRIEFGTRYILFISGILCLLGALFIFWGIRKQLTFRIMVGLPELAPQRYSGILLTEGIYARIRHPRYAQLVLALLGYAVIANYLVTYILFLLMLPVLFFVILLEERELRDRFGDQYVKYSARVPRFIPRFTKDA